MQQLQVAPMLLTVVLLFFTEIIGGDQTTREKVGSHCAGGRDRIEDVGVERADRSRNGRHATFDYARVTLKVLSQIGDELDDRPAGIVPILVGPVGSVLAHRPIESRREREPLLGAWIVHASDHRTGSQGALLLLWIEAA